ncbi:MAG: aspartyl/glutamyl-tRNA amidotransferase subunit C [Clostridia bacterium]|nr:aspartyl/glutamyl-tRNA amidotransferase subunit C [Clostridia bacterium]
MDERITEITKNTAFLARLSLTEEELSSFSKDMTSIYHFASQVSEANDGMGKDICANGALRADTEDSFDDVTALLAVAPKGSLVDGCFTVPKAVD